jgi:hypothetical protein
MRVVGAPGELSFRILVRPFLALIVVRRARIRMPLPEYEIPATSVPWGPNLQRQSFFIAGTSHGLQLAETVQRNSLLPRGSMPGSGG